MTNMNIFSSFLNVTGYSRSRYDDSEYLKYEVKTGGIDRERAFPVNSF